MFCQEKMMAIMLSKRIPSIPKNEIKITMEEKDQSGGELLGVTWRLAITIMISYISHQICLITVISSSLKNIRYCLINDIQSLCRPHSVPTTFREYVTKARSAEKAVACQEAAVKSLINPYDPIKR